MSAVIPLEFDTRVYRLEAVKKAAYRFSGRFSFEIRVEQHLALVSMSPRQLDSSSEMAAADFRAEVLDQELREVVAAETETVRNLIVAQAFSKTSLLDEAGETADFRTDPLVVSRPDGEG